MTANPNPTWYDILGVARDASPAEIKAAWRDATDKFEPGSGQGQFRLFNDAADVLLDPDKRAEYDASLSEPDLAEPELPTPSDRPSQDISEETVAEPAVEPVASTKPEADTAPKAEAAPKAEPVLPVVRRCG